MTVFACERRRDERATAVPGADPCAGAPHQGCAGRRRRGDLLDELRGLVAGSAAPFGVAVSTWDDMLSLSRRVVDTSEEGDQDAVQASARALRDLLRAYV